MTSDHHDIMMSCCDSMSLATWPVMMWQVISGRHMLTGFDSFWPLAMASSFGRIGAAALSQFVD